MGFHQALSGLNAASKSLDIIGHNIANSGTTGFKSSRAEFSEVVASALGSSSGESFGIGVETAAVTQMFKQGNISPTGNSLDVAINGNGFFVVKQLDGTSAYTRAGNFRVDDQGDLRTISGDYVLATAVNPLTNKAEGSADVVRLPIGKIIPAKQTSTATVSLNLDARAHNAAGDPTANPPIPATSRATYGTAFSVHDQQGNSVPVNTYFEKSSANQWTIYNQLDNLTAVPPVINAPLAFMQMNTVGQPTGLGVASGAISTPAITLGTAAVPPDAAIPGDKGTPGSQTGEATQEITYKYIDVNETDPLKQQKILTLQRVWSYEYVVPADPTVDPYIASSSYEDFYTNAAGALVAFSATDPAALAAGKSTGQASMGFTLALEVDSRKFSTNNLPNFMVDVDLSGITQYGTDFSVSRLSQDGYKPGSLTGISISDNGMIVANYSNGIKREEAQLEMADFVNPQGLAAVGGDKWIATPESGNPNPGKAKTGTFGSLISNALEESNVDLTAELVNMMTAQRAYQASAQAIKTQDQVFSTLVNLR